MAHPRILASLLVAATLAAAAPVWADNGGTERLLVAPPGGWVQAADPQKRPNVTRFVPEGETLAGFTRMMSVEIMPGLRSDPGQLLDQIKQSHDNICEAVGAGGVGPRMVNGYPSGLRVLTCTKNRRSAKGEVFMYDVIAGRDAVYVVQLVWRGEPFAKDKMPLTKEQLQDWADFLHAAKLCDMLDRNHPCQ